MKYYKEPQTQMHSFEQPTYSKMGEVYNLECQKPFGLHSLKITAWVLLKFKLDLVGTEEVWWGNSNTEPTHDFTFFYTSGSEDH
jgi:hypothetical protein